MLTWQNVLDASYPIYDAAHKAYIAARVKGKGPRGAHTAAMRAAERASRSLHYLCSPWTVASEIQDTFDPGLR